MKNKFKKMERELTLLAALAVIVIVFTVINPIYISVLNISDIIEQSVIFGLMGIGMTFVIITGGIDLSVGSILALVAVTAAKLSSGGMNVVGVVVISALLGAVLGLVNGFMVSYMKLQPFIATMGSMSIYRGISYIVTDGFPVSGVASSFRSLFYGKIAVGLRSSVVVLIVFAIIAHVLLKYTRFGNYVYAMGGNEEATKLSGVRVDRNRVVAYIICGVGSGLAAMILIAKLASGEPTAGNGYEFNCRSMYWWNKYVRRTWYNSGNCDRCNLILGIKGWINNFGSRYFLAICCNRRCNNYCCLCRNYSVETG